MEKLPGTAIAANPRSGLPRLDVYEPNGYEAFTYPPGSPLEKWNRTGGGLAILRELLLRAQDRAYPLVDPDHHHFFTARHGQDGTARVGLLFADSTSEADRCGRPPGLQQVSFRMPNQDASTLEGLIRANPLSYPYFLNKAAPGLLRPESASPPGIKADRSKTVTLINYSKLYPVIKETAEEANMSVALGSGSFSEAWPTASETLTYPS